MTRRYEPIGELDLNAYADGLLEGDALRRAEIEQYLASDADAAAHVAEIQAQNREIREAYGAAVAQPVPDRVMGALAQDNKNRGRRLVGASAAVVLLGVALGVGWLAGQRDDGDEWALEEFARRAASQHQASSAAGAVQPAGGSSAPVAEPMAWLNQRIALEIRAPDLSAEGFELIAKAMVGPRDDRSVQLVYQDDEGTMLNLFLRPRWEERSSPINVVQSDGVAAHYWLDGPLAFALTSSAPGPDAERLARAVHQAVERSRLADPAPKPILSEGLSQVHGPGAEGRGLPTSSSMPGSLENGRPGAARPQFN